MFFCIEEAVFPFTLFVCFGEKEYFLDKIKPELEADDYNQIVEDVFHAGKAIAFDSGHVLLWLKEKPHNPVTYAMLAHEVYHVVNYILEYANVPNTKDTEEVYAYMITYVTRKIYEELEK